MLSMVCTNPSEGAICSQIKITTRALRKPRSATASKVISNLRRTHFQFAKTMLGNKVCLFGFDIDSDSWNKSLYLYLCSFKLVRRWLNSQALWFNLESGMVSGGQRGTGNDRRGTGMSVLTEKPSGRGHRVVPCLPIHQTAYTLQPPPFASSE